MWEYVDRNPFHKAALPKTKSAPSLKRSLFEWQNEQKKSAIGELPRLIFAYEDNRPLQGGVLMKYFQIFWSNAISRKWPSTAYAIAVSPISWFWQAATSRQCREILTTRKQTWLPRSMAAYWMQIAVRTRKDLRKNSTKIVAPRRVIEPKSIRLGGGSSIEISNRCQNSRWEIAIHTLSE